MKKPEDLDSLYKGIISKLEKKEQITYCENLIDSEHNNLVKRKNHHKSLYDNHYEILLAAQHELKNLKNIKP